MEGLDGALSGSFTRRVVANVYHGTDRVVEGLPVESWSVSGDLGAGVSHSGSAVAVYESVDGESLSPVGTRGVLSPFRARVELVMEVTAGDWSGSVPLGTFRVTAAGPAKDFMASRTDWVRRFVYVPNPAVEGTFILGSYV